jgi:hypothetical protein
MKYRIQASPDGGFEVQMFAPDTEKPFVTVEGFATHEAAADFITQVLVEFMRVFQRRDG